MSNWDLGQGIAFAALGVVLGYFAVDGFLRWRAVRREKAWQKELQTMLSMEEAMTTMATREAQRRIDEAYRHSLPPDPEAVLRAERMTKAGAMDQQGNTLYGWSIPGYESEGARVEAHKRARAEPAPGDPVFSSRRRVERAEERRKNEEASRRMDAVEFNRTRPSYQHEVFPGGGPPIRTAPESDYSPASASVVRDVPFTPTGGGSFDGGGASASYGSSGSSCSSSSGSSSSDSGSSSSSSGGGD